MYRRDFLKLGGMLSAAVFMQFNPLGKAASLPVEVESQGKYYRGTFDGKIYVSANAGKTWQLHTNFGSEFSILRLSAAFGEQVRAELGFSGQSFELALAPNSNFWRTQ